jgi:hypothetical protein
VDQKTSKCFHCGKQYQTTTLIKGRGICGHCWNKKIPDGSKATIPAAVRRDVWITYMGDKVAVAQCYCCNRQQIDVWSFECGHVQAESKGGDTTVANLRPICGLCNRSMATENMLVFVQKSGFRSKMHIEEMGWVDVEKTHHVRRNCITC